MPLLPPRPATKTSVFKSFLLVMFSASKEGGSRGGTSLFFRAGTPSYTHIIRRSSPVLLSLFTSARPQSNTSPHQTCIRGGLPLFSENLRRPLLGNRAFGVGRSRKAGTGFCKGRLGGASFVPALHNLPVGNAKHVYLRHRRPSAGRRDTEKLALMSSIPNQAERNLIFFGDQVLNFKEGIGKGLGQSGHELLEALMRVGLGWHPRDVLNDVIS